MRLPVIMAAGAPLAADSPVADFPRALSSCANSAAAGDAGPPAVLAPAPLPGPLITEPAAMTIGAPPP